jgi:hypothetical protein
MNKNLDRFEWIDFSFIHEQRDKRIEKAILAKKIRIVVKVLKILLKLWLVIAFFTLLVRI